VYDISRYIEILRAVNGKEATMFRRDRMFHGSWWESPFHKGDLKYVILDLIRDSPRYGYEIIRILEERSHGFYAPSPGAVYPTLQLLEEMGYISATQQDGKKVYSITDEGRRFLTDREEFAEGIKKHMKDRWGFRDASEMRDTMAELRRLGRLMARRFGKLDREKMRHIRDIISRACVDIEAILEE
jgi:DNA-binding PadR family transcriptional regulator